MIINRLYQSPECETDVAFRMEMLCSSPDPIVDGGLEGIEEEDWVI